MTGDREDELAAMHLSTVALTPSWFVRILTAVPVAIFLIIPVLFRFIFKHEPVYTVRVLAVFDFYFRT